MSPEGKRGARATRPDRAAAWDFGGAFGASLRAWNQRGDQAGEERTPASASASAEAPVADLPRVMSSRTRGVMQGMLSNDG
jgi:hypothetical protein